MVVCELWRVTGGWTLYQYIEGGYWVLVTLTHRVRVVPVCRCLHSSPSLSQIEKLQKEEEIASNPDALQEEAEEGGCCRPLFLFVLHGQGMCLSVIHT